MTHHPALGTLCDIFCDIAGLEEFVNLIQNSDFDAFFFCEKVSVCPINDNGDATITSFIPSPASGSQGTTFEFDLSFTSKNGTGTSEIFLGITTVDGIPLST